MNWDTFVNLVSVTRLEVLGIALVATILLGILGALKSKSFKWVLIASFLQPSLNFFYMIMGYLATAAVCTFILPDAADAAAVVTTYTLIVIGMVAKIKEQLAFLGVPLTGFKLPLETKVE